MTPGSRGDRQLSEPRGPTAGHVGASEVSRAKLQENIDRSIEYLRLKMQGYSPLFLPLDVVISMASIQTYSYTTYEYRYRFEQNDKHSMKDVMHKKATIRGEA
jgi:hypothetical protein